MLKVILEDNRDATEEPKQEKPAHSQMRIKTKSEEVEVVGE